MIEILPNENDDLGFTEIVENIINKTVENIAPEEIYLTKIDNWFDFKWLAFSGKLAGAVGFWNDELTVPPFIPDRVMEQSYFQRLNETYVKQVGHKLHGYQSSGENIGRKLKSYSFARTRIFVWFSGNTKNSLRGSIMIYQIIKEAKYSFYVSFLKKDDWQIYKTDEISRNEVLSLMK
jgi:hypothetical protein